jgi:HEPN domain-containing protein
MRNETQKWLEYGEENLASAGVLLDSDLYNPCLQNVQQAVEKLLKALLVESAVRVRKTHSIAELMVALSQLGLSVSLSEDEIDLLDSIYLPSKYPVGSALPKLDPDRAVCERCVGVAQRVRDSVMDLLGGK